MKTVLVVNPCAGRQTIVKELESVQKVFLDRGDMLETVETQSARQAEEALRRILAAAPERLICCGGDGTLSQTVDLVLKAGAHPDVGYIPAGTTNDFASSLGLPREPVKAARKIAAGIPRPLDAGRFQDRHFIYIASFGAFTQSSYSTNQNLKNSLGHFAYLLEGLKELPALQPYRVQVETAEGEAYEGEYIFGCVSNTTSIGGVIKLEKDKVDLDDGLFELILVKPPKNLAEFNQMVLSLISGKLDCELLTFTHTRKAVFTCGEPMPWSLDGEYAPGAERVEAEVLHRAVRLYC